ncbi:MAG: cation:H+ antiporter [Candidatus Kentron sp. G]|nr:MAG: cation:H+ antiporter [Candidatus Kentron sp. G]VFN06239.1 MAG: cation:H+ antiporter [Candidatus Kentron sp. G]VFN06669.1 MAG: cation:H+ antiporter [Candidatus Kentron sp. G]
MKIKATFLNIFALLICYFLIRYRNETPSIYLELIIFILSIYSLVKAADIFTELAVFVGSSFGLSKLATGTLIIAIGTSAPELFASIGAAIQHQPDMVVGNILGTVIANSLLGIGFAAMAARRSLFVHKDVVGWKMSVFLVAILLALVGLYDGALVYYEGLLMLPLFFYYLFFIYKTNNEKSNTKIGKEVISAIVLLAINLGVLFVSGDFVVSSLVESADLLDFSSAKLATSILAVGTSIPEIATAIALVRQNNADSLFGEIIGSNIFDILGILGFISLFGTLTMEVGLLLYLSISLVATFVIVSMIMHDKNINKIEGFSLVLLFSLFTIQLVNI